MRLGILARCTEKKPWKKYVRIEIVWRKGQYLEREEAQTKKNILRSGDNFSADLKMKTGLYAIKIGYHVENKDNKRKRLLHG